MPVEDAVKFVYKDFVSKTKKLPQNVYQHPDAVLTLLKTLSDNRSLTVLQYDHLIKHLTQRREVQRKAEIGEDADVDFIEPTVVNYTNPLAQSAKSVAPALTKQEELQKKVMEILNRKPIAVAKPADIPTKPMTEAQKNELKERLFKDDKIQAAMRALRRSNKWIAVQAFCSASSSILSKEVSSSVKIFKLSDYKDCSRNINKNYSKTKGQNKEISNKYLIEAFLSQGVS